MEFFFGKKPLSVEAYKNDIKLVFYVDVTAELSLDYVPKKLCRKCYNRIKNVKERKTTIDLNRFTWEPHSDNCKTCSHVDNLKRGGRKMKQNPIPPPACSLWTRQKSESLKSQIPQSIISSELLSELDQELNPQIGTILCDKCENIVTEPLRIMKCGHLFCFGCLMTVIEGRRLEELNCPNCQLHVRESDFGPCMVTNKILDSLLTKCRRDCGKTFNNTHCNLKSSHKKKCQGRAFTLVDILELPEGSPLPKEAEKAAAKILKTKMAESTLPNKTVELKTGVHA